VLELDLEKFLVNFLYLCKRRLIILGGIRVISKVRKTQHHNPENAHTQGKIQKKSAKKYISIQQGVKLTQSSIFVVNWVFILSLVLLEPLH
jgi:hypothetical protein